MKLKMKSALALGVILSPIVLSTVANADIATDVVSEKWGKPTLVYGGGLSDAEVTTVNSQLGIKNIDNVTRQVVTGQDMDKYLGLEGSATSNMFSSVMVQKRDKGKGVHVDIKTPTNITQITPLQYSNAAITAGATDLEIEVASPKPVTGESALTGVYKALEANGDKVDQERATVAQDELSATNTIAQAHKYEKDFDPTLLDNALTGIKTDLADYKKSKGQLADSQQVKDIVNDNLKKSGLNSIISADEVSQLVDFAQKFQSTSAIDDKEMLNQLGDLKDAITEKAGNLLKSANEHGVFEKAGAFFSSIWESIKSLFS